MWLKYMYMCMYITCIYMFHYIVCCGYKWYFSLFIIIILLVHTCTYSLYNHAYIHVHVHIQVNMEAQCNIVIFASFYNIELLIHFSIVILSTQKIYFICKLNPPVWQIFHTDFCFQEVAREYESRRIPLDVMVTDMDWHITFYKENKKDQVCHMKINIDTNHTILKCFFSHKYFHWWVFIYSFCTVCLCILLH